MCFDHDGSKIQLMLGNILQVTLYEFQYGGELCSEMYCVAAIASHSRVMLLFADKEMIENVPSGRDLQCKSILSDCGVVKIQFADLPIYLDNTLEESSAKICAQPISADVLRNILFIAAHCGMFPDMTKVTASDINNIASMFVIKTKAESLLEMQGPQEFREEKGLTSSETTSCAFGEREREREKATKRERTRASNTGRQDFNRQEFSCYRRFI